MLNKFLSFLLIIMSLMPIAVFGQNKNTIPKLEYRVNNYKIEAGNSNSLFAKYPNIESIIITSKSKNESVVLDACCGGVMGTTFRITLIKTKELTDELLESEPYEIRNNEEFQTNSGIKLGMSFYNIDKIKNFQLSQMFKKKKISKNEIIYIFEKPFDRKIQNDLGDKFKNMPNYYEKYYFKKDKLYRLDFGFQYP